MQKISIECLERLVSNLNRETNNPLEQYTRQADGTLKANCGNYFLDNAYGGWRLCQVMNDQGGCRDVLHAGYRSKRECYDLVFAYRYGVSTAISLRAQ